MPLLERLTSWLRGPKLSDLNRKLEIVCRKLELESLRLDKQAKNNRAKAKKARLEGDNQAAETYIHHYLKFKNSIIEIDSYRLGIEGLLVDLKMKEAVSEVSKILGNLKYVISIVKNRIRIPDLTKTLEEIDQSMKHISSAKDLAEKRIQSITRVSEIKPEDVQKALNEIDQEIAVEAERGLPEPSGKVSELEKEIEKMKESNT
ncbi:MAG: SNF7 family protein [Candidatus Odinarchaeum yellowstonii]|uniref:SNF7 family protein n=1 Tax=Odinarchaeota yellowstonii (strain LCB_4) TaxID=1841599 RepID=A0AAF0IAE8_ODILC|nr:MAG: SNF7 family protein [Candidatus Odinarchaeum yellowstonii]